MTKDLLLRLHEERDMLLHVNKVWTHLHDKSFECLSILSDQNAFLQEQLEKEHDFNKELRAGNQDLAAQLLETREEALATMRRVNTKVTMLAGRPSSPRSSA